LLSLRLLLLFELHLQHRDLGAMLALLPVDLFRIIFGYLPLEDLISTDRASHANHCLRELLQLSFIGFTISTPLHYPDDAEVLHWLTNKQMSLTEFSLGASEDTSLEILSKQLATVKALSLSSLSDLSMFTVSQTPQLTSLSLDGCDLLQTDTLRRLLKCSPRLESLDLSGTSSLATATFDLLAAHCPRIVSLCLQHNLWLTDTAVCRLMIPACPFLKSIDLAYTSVQEEATIIRLVDSYPELCYLFFTIDNLSAATLHTFFEQVIFRPILALGEGLTASSTGAAVSATRCLVAHLHTIAGGVPNRLLND
jgi:hypothetical protein